MKTIVTIVAMAVLLAMVACGDDLKLSEKERLAIRDPQVKVLALQTQLTQLQSQYEATKKQLDDASKELTAAVTATMTAHKCKECGFNTELTMLTKPAPKVIAKK